MRRSSERILTTHAGSLPRPEHLTSLFVRRARGEGVDPVAIAKAGREALRAIVPLQASAGIDVGNNGEQQHDSFFLYLKDRLTGLGGTWQRPSRADVDRYPEFKKRWLEQMSSKSRVSPNEGLPMAIGEVHYIDPAIIDAVPALARDSHRGAGDFEIQMLYGIRDAEQRRLADAGNHVRVYVPFGTQWYGYFVRRLAERPANLTFFLRALAERRH